MKSEETREESRETEDEREIESKCEGGSRCDGERGHELCLCDEIYESGGERDTDGRTAGMSRTLARQDLPKTNPRWLVFLLLRNPSVLQPTRTVRVKWRRYVLDRRHHR